MCFLVLTRQSCLSYIPYLVISFVGRPTRQTVANTLGPEWTAGSTRLLFRGREMKANNATLEVKRAKRRGELAAFQCIVAAVVRRVQYTLKGWFGGGKGC